MQENDESAHSFPRLQTVLSTQKQNTINLTHVSSNPVQNQHYYQLLIEEWRALLYIIKAIKESKVGILHKYAKAPISKEKYQSM